MIGKRTCTIGIAALAFTANPAFAAGFEGSYWGVNVGLFNAKTDADQAIFKPNVGGNATTHQRTIDGFNSMKPSPEQTSMIGGGQIGHNWRVGPVLLGAEADLNYWHYRATESSQVSFPVNVGNRVLTSENSTESSYLMTLRPRIGFTFGEGSMVYASAGIAYTDLRYNHVSEAASPNGVPITYRASVQKSMGKVVGAGYEMAWSSNMKVRLDYQYLAFDKTSVTASAGQTFTDLQGSSITANFETKVHLLRLGANWSF